MSKGDRSLVKDIEVDIEVGIETYDVTFTRYTTIEHEADYGADADGNRGIARDFIGDDYAKDIFVNGKPIADYDKKIQEEIERGIDLYINENDPE